MAKKLVMQSDDYLYLSQWLPSSIANDESDYLAIEQVMACASISFGLLAVLKKPDLHFFLLVSWSDLIRGFFELLGAETAFTAQNIVSPQLFQSN